MQKCIYRACGLHRAQLPPGLDRKVVRATRLCKNTFLRCVSLKMTWGQERRRSQCHFGRGRVSLRWHASTEVPARHSKARSNQSKLQSRKESGGVLLALSFFGQSCVGFVFPADRAAVRDNADSHPGDVWRNTELRGLLQLQYAEAVWTHDRDSWHCPEPHAHRAGCGIS